jgi:hypothetical protein
MNAHSYEFDSGHRHFVAHEMVETNGENEVLGYVI